MNIDNEYDKKIVMDVLNKLNMEYESHKYYNDGVSSRVILLNKKYLIKQSTPLSLQAEVEFLNLNKQKMLQKVIYADTDYKYVVYEFIEGEVMYDVDDPTDTIKKILRLVSSYKKYDGNGYGYLDELEDTWSEFLYKEMADSSKNIKKYIPSMDIVVRCISILKKYKFDKKLIHGDFGTHNFIKRNGKLIGIIDPMTISGDSLYDILFAFVSNTDILITITIDDMYSLINEEKEKIHAMLLLVLYSRISRCLKYHPNDINIYMDYWEKISNI